jgi:membrane-associated phospholipid phosphatase
MAKKSPSAREMKGDAIPFFPFASIGVHSRLKYLNFLGLLLGLVTVAPPHEIRPRLAVTFIVVPPPSTTSFPDDHPASATFAAGLRKATMCESWEISPTFRRSRWITS